MFNQNILLSKCGGCTKQILLFKLASVIVQSRQRWPAGHTANFRALQCVKHMALTGGECRHKNTDWPSFAQAAKQPDSRKKWTKRGLAFSSKFYPEQQRLNMMNGIPRSRRLLQQAAFHQSSRRKNGANNLCKSADSTSWKENDEQINFNSGLISISLRLLSWVGQHLPFY